MVLKRIGKGIKGAVDGFAKGCAVVLIALGLWVPALYSVAFLLVCLFAHIRLGGTTTVVYCLGLGISAALGGAFAVWRYRRKRLSGEEALRQPEERTRLRAGKRRDRQRAEASRANDCEQAAPLGAAADSAGERLHTCTPAQPTAQWAPDPVGWSYEQPSNRRDSTTYDDYADLERKYFGATESVSGTEPPAAQRSDPPRPAGPDAARAEELWRRLSGERADERPLVFATRTDRNVFIYEYSDRLEYWRRTTRGMTLMGTEYKEHMDRAAR